MLVKDRMTLNPYTVTPETPLQDAFAIMRDHNFRRLPVVKLGKIVGMVTERELHRVTPSDATTLSVFELNYLLSKMTVADAMTKNPVTIQDTQQLEDAAILMRKHDIGELPVLRDKRLVGIITETDIFDSFIDMLGARHTGTRLCVVVPNEPGVGADVFTIISKFEVNIQHMVLNNTRQGAELTFKLDTDDASDIKRALTAKGYKIVEE